jgi:hypothetical protein
MSTNTKRLLLIIGIAAAFCLVAVGVAVGGLALLGNRFKNNFVTDPAKVQQMAHGFINYKLPPDYTEQMGMDFLVYKMILIGPPESANQPMIFLAQFQAANMSAEQMTQQMQQSVEQQSGTNGLKLKVVETRNVTINGKQTALTVSEGTNRTGSPYRQWITAFPAKSGMILVMIQGTVDGWDDAAMNSFLASITW